MSIGDTLTATEWAMALLIYVELRNVHDRLGEPQTARRLAVSVFWTAMCFCMAVMALVERIAKVVAP